MALRTFWAEVAVRNPLFKGGMSQPDPPLVKPQELEAALSKKNEWQFAGPIRGFDDADFDFLPEDKRRVLAMRVQEFNDLAPKLRALVNRQLTDEGALEEMAVANRARPLLREIVLLLEQDRHADPDALVIGKQIEAKLKMGWPKKLDHLRFMTGSDSTGDPALWIWAYTKEKDSGEYAEDEFLAAVEEIDPVLKRVAEEVTPERWPYISYRSTLDQLEYEAVA